MLSETTMALSINIPIPMVSPVRERRLKVPPFAQITMTAIRSDSGIAPATIKVLDIFLMKSHRINTASSPPHAQESRRLVSDLVITFPWSKKSANSIPAMRGSELICSSRTLRMLLQTLTVFASDSLEMSMILQSRPFNLTTKSRMPNLIPISAISPSLSESVTGNCLRASRSSKRDPRRRTNFLPESSTVPAEPSTLSPWSLEMRFPRSRL